MDVHAPSVGVEFVGVDVCAHQQAGPCRHSGGSVAHRRTIDRIDVGKGGCFDRLNVASTVESSLKSGCASAFQQVVRIVECPPTDRIWNGSIIGRRGESGCERNRLVVPRVVGSDFSCVFRVCCQTFDGIRECLRHICRKVELREDEGAFYLCFAFKDANLIAEDAFVVRCLREGDFHLAWINIQCQFCALVEGRCRQARSKGNIVWVVVSIADICILEHTAIKGRFQNPTMFRVDFHIAIGVVATYLDVAILLFHENHTFCNIGITFGMYVC